MNKINRTTIASFMLVLALTSAPLTSLAKNTNDQNNRDNTVRASIFSRIADAFTARLHLNASTKPIISGIKAPTTLAVGEEGIWTLNASDPKNGSLNYAVDWGDSASIARRMGVESFTQTSTFSHTYDAKGTYTVTFTVTNADGAKATSSATVRVTDAKSVAPVISDVHATSTKSQQATIAWKTDTRSSGSIWYGTQSPVATDGTAQIFRKAKVRNHKIVLNKLDAGTTYYVIVGSSNANGSSKASEISFTTPGKLGSEVPVIESFTGDTSIIAGESATLTVTAHDPKNRALSYSMNWGDTGTMNLMAKRAEPVFSQTTTFEHEYANAGTYTAVATVENDIGKKVSQSLTITVAADR